MAIARTKLKPIFKLGRGAGEAKKLKVSTGVKNDSGQSNPIATAIAKVEPTAYRRIRISTISNLLEIAAVKLLPDIR
jgi:hypothetical protein